MACTERPVALLAHHLRLTTLHSRITYPLQEAPYAWPQLGPHAHVVEAVQLLLAVPLACAPAPVVHCWGVHEAQGGRRGRRGTASAREGLRRQDV